MTHTELQSFLDKLPPCPRCGARADHSRFYAEHPEGWTQKREVIECSKSTWSGTCDFGGVIFFEPPSQADWLRAGRMWTALCAAEAKPT